MAREALIERNTKETQIRLQLNIDGTGSSDIDSPGLSYGQAMACSALFFPR